MRQVTQGSTNISVDVYIIDATDGTPELGVLFNTAGLDLEYRRESGAVVNITEIDLTTPALTDAHEDGGFLEIGHGYYRLDLPDAAVASGAKTVSIQGTVTGMVVLPTTIQIIAFDLDTASVAQTADHTAAIADIPTVAEFNARTLLAASYFDPTADAVANVTLVATTTALTDVINASSIVASVSGNVDGSVDSVTGDTKQTADHTAAIADIPTVAEFNARTLVAASYFDPAADTVVNVTNVTAAVTVGTMNTNVINAASIAAAAMDGKGDWNIGKTGYSLTITPPTAVENRQEMDTNSVDLNSLISGQSTINGNVLAIDTATMRGTDGANTVVPDAAGTAPTVAEILAGGDIDGFSLEESQKLILAASVGVLAGAATNSITIKAADGSKTRITATVDTDGNRSVVVKDVTG